MGRFSSQQVTRAGSVVATCVYTAAPRAGSAAPFALPTGFGHASDAVPGTSSLFPDPPLHVDVYVLVS